MVVVSAGHEYVDGTGGSSVVSRAADVLGMSVVVRREELVECVKYVCVWFGAV